MKIVFVDTNVLVDLIADRKPFSKYAIELFSKAESKKVKLYTSSHSFAVTYYLLKKYIDEKKLREVLFILLDYISLVAVDTEIIKKGLTSKYKDFEGAIQIIAANSISKLDYIVTRDLKDYKDAGVVVLTSDELVKNI